MTETAPPLSPAVPQQPVEPPAPTPKWRFSSRWVAIGVVAAGLVATVWIFREPLTRAITSHNATTADAPGATLRCDSGLVAVHSMTHDGVTINVTAPGPNVVQVDVWNSYEHRRDAQQRPVRAAAEQLGGSSGRRHRRHPPRSAAPVLHSK